MYQMGFPKMGLVNACGFLAILLLLSSGANRKRVTAERLFMVGDDFGWQEPSTGANDTDVYSLWATSNRFRVGDSLLFVYKNDSVVEVDKWSYYHCDKRNPVKAFNNGRSIFKVDKPGPFYYISGAPNHCRNGQRLLVEVMGFHHHDSRYASPPHIANPPDQSYYSNAPSPSASAGSSLVTESVAVVSPLFVLAVAGLVLVRI